ncbi:MAG: tRNA(Ile)-lysidine synthase [Rickettsiales bacterium]|jgi:tRNA(Ile)-lysidine synthase
MEKEFSLNIQEIFSQKLPSRIAVAVSGGLDSMALLLLLKNFLDQEGSKTEIFCVSIDHNIRSNSAADAQFVADFCHKNSINCTVLKSYLEQSPESDIENSLRQVRYNLFEQFCDSQKIEHIFIAHHEQDLAENFLIRLFRGSGIDGLSAIPKISFHGKLQIIRPLLDFSKDDLRQYLLAQKVDWVEDETNEDEKFLRNKIRNFLQTLPDSGAINSRIALASNAILEAREILAKETKENFPKIFTPYLADPADSEGLILDIDKFKKLKKSIATRYLSLALMEVSGRKYKPRLKKLERIYWLIMNDELKQKEGCYGCVLSEILGKKSGSGRSLQLLASR